VDWNRHRPSWSWTVFAAAVLVLQLGSRGDRFVIAAVWLALVFLPVERYACQFARLMARAVLPRYVPLSVIALVWSWATCRFRVGGGPLHIGMLGNWRGYPFPFEEWIFILNPSPASLREFHWFGLVADLLVPAAALLAVVRWLQRSGATVEKTRAFFLVGFTVAFVWLNIDFWMGGLPLTWINSQPEIRFFGEARRGFPFPYEGLLPFPAWHWPALALDVVIGLAAWTALYCAGPAARLIQSRQM
jgi:hypothetical protein